MDILPFSSKRSLGFLIVLCAFLPIQFSPSSQVLATHAQTTLPSRSIHPEQTGRQPNREPATGSFTQAIRPAIDLGFVIDLANSPASPGLIFLFFGGSNPFLYGNTERGCWQALDGSPVGYTPNTRIGLTMGDGTPRFLASTNPGFVSWTDDYGETWAPGLPPTGNPGLATALAVSPIDPIQLFAEASRVINDPIIGPITAGELYVSQTGGSTWKLLAKEYVNFHPLLPSPVVPGRLYVRKLFAVGMQSGSDWYTYEPDKSWDHQVTTHLAIPGDDLLAPDPLDPSIIYAYDPETKFSYRMINGERIDGAAVNGDQSTRLLAHPGRSGQLILQSSGGVYRSLDGGDHWELLTYSLGGLIYADFSFGGRLLLAKTDGIYVSTDFAETWEKRISFEAIEGCPRESRFYFPLIYTRAMIE